MDICARVHLPVVWYLPVFSSVASTSSVTYHSSIYEEHEDDIDSSGYLLPIFSRWDYLDGQLVESESLNRVARIQIFSLVTLTEDLSASCLSS